MWMSDARNSTARWITRLTSRITGASEARSRRCSTSSRSLPSPSAFSTIAPIALRPWPYQRSTRSSISERNATSGRTSRCDRQPHRVEGVGVLRVGNQHVDRGVAFRHRADMELLHELGGERHAFRRQLRHVLDADQWQVEHFGDGFGVVAFGHQPQPRQQRQQAAAGFLLQAPRAAQVGVLEAALGSNTSTMRSSTLAAVIESTVFMSATAFTRPPKPVEAPGAAADISPPGFAARESGRDPSRPRAPQAHRGRARQPTNTRALRNIRSHGESSPHSRGAQLRLACAGCARGAASGWWRGRRRWSGRRCRRASRSGWPGKWSRPRRCHRRSAARRAPRLRRAALSNAARPSPCAIATGMREPAMPRKNSDGDLDHFQQAQARLELLAAVAQEARPVLARRE